ncbi:hypothetical protein GOODEAATRI_033563 [Goodea atripinnis]|uniref:Uncharacterized protein n=1 Tax=Goodea atripinnis TaxID=208336 RepID=A0ABV0MX88_9TELE
MLRNMYSVKTDLNLLNYTNTKANESGQEYVERILKVWEEQTGQSPLMLPLQKPFKEPMIKGQTVRDEMLKLVALGQLLIDQWVATLVHHIDRKDENQKQNAQEN